MICERCHGTGHEKHLMVYFWHSWWENKPCPECGGSGIASCCDAAGSAQPEPASKEDTP